MLSNRGWRRNRDAKDSKDVISAFFDLLTSDLPSSPESWKEFHRLLGKRYNKFSECLGKYTAEEDLIHLLALLLIPIARNGFRDGQRCQKLFTAAEAMGVHLLPVHYYSPVPDTKSLAGQIWQHRFDDPGWSLNEASQLKLLNELGHWGAELTDVPVDSQDPRQFSWNNPAITPTDAAVYYAFIRNFRPRLVIEVGSGYSTLIAAKACLKNGFTELCAVEPYPMEVLQKGVPGLHKLFPVPVQELPVENFQRLGANDILFIDSTHVCKTGSDLNYLLLQVVPRLAPGVLIHFHDIFLPWEYAEHWIKEKHIFWNEQYLLLAFLLFNRAYEVLLATQFLGREHPDLLGQAFPFGTVPGGGSFWLRRLRVPDELKPGTVALARS